MFKLFQKKKKKKKDDNKKRNSEKNICHNGWIYNSRRGVN